MNKVSMFFLLVALCVFPVMTSHAANLVLNGSFEDSAMSDTWPFYGPIDNWTNPGGLNNSSGPFWDNGTHVNGSQVAFKQGSGVMSQDVDGFVNGQQYTLRFAENMRNCCNEPSVDLVVRVGGSDIVAQHTIVVGEFVAVTADFTAPVDGIMSLEFEVIVTAGDGTFLVDAVSICPKGEQDPFPLNTRPPGIIANGSFELSEPAGTWPWYGVAQWWTSTTATCGVNDNTGPFWDNGTNVDGTQVGFLQGAGTLSQTAIGFEAGKNYTLYFRENARSGGALPNMKVTMNGVEILADHQIAVGEFVKRSVDFASPGAGDYVLAFVCTAPQGDSTVLLDAIAIVEQGQADPYATYCWPINVYRTITTPTIDGVVNVGTEYSNAQVVDLQVATLNIDDPYNPDCTHGGTVGLSSGTVTGVTDSSALIYFLWDASALFVAVVGQDEQLNPATNGCGQWACGTAGVNQGDTFQLCLDYDQGGAADGQAVGAKVYIPSWALYDNANTVDWFQQFWPVDDPNPFTGMTYNMKTNATGYVLETRIPWTAFTAGGDTYTQPFPPINGQTCGVLPMLEDNDDGNVSFMYTAGNGGNIIVNASGYNDLVFYNSTTAVEDWTQY